MAVIISAVSSARSCFLVQFYAQRGFSLFAHFLLDSRASFLFELQSQLCLGTSFLLSFRTQLFFDLPAQCVLFSLAPRFSFDSNAGFDRCTFLNVAFHSQARFLLDALSRSLGLNAPAIQIFNPSTSPW